LAVTREQSATKKHKGPGEAKPQPDKTEKIAAFAFYEESVPLGSPISRLARLRFLAFGRLCEILGIARFHPLGSTSPGAGFQPLKEKEPV
jgi:hypothetical protein